MPKEKKQGVGFEWSTGSGAVTVWSEPVFVFYNEEGEKREVGLGGFSPGHVQEWNPNSSQNSSSTFLRALDPMLESEAINKMPESVLKIMMEFLSDDEKAIVKLELNYKKEKKRLMSALKEHEEEKRLEGLL